MTVPTLLLAIEDLDDTQLVEMAPEVGRDGPGGWSGHRIRMIEVFDPISRN